MGWTSEESWFDLRNGEIFSFLCKVPDSYSVSNGVTSQGYVFRCIIEGHVFIIRTKTSFLFILYRNTQSTIYLTLRLHQY